MHVHENTRQTMPIKEDIVNEKNRIWFGLFIVTVLELISSLPAMIWPCGSSTEWNIDTFYDIINVVPIKALLILILALIIGILTGNIGQKNVNTLGAVTLGFLALVILYEFVKIFAAIANGNFDTLTTFCKMSIIASPICGLLQLSMLLGILGDARLKRYILQDDQNVVTPKAYEFLMQLNKPEIPKALLGWTFLCVSTMAQVMATLYFGQAVDSALDKYGDIWPNLEYMGGAGLVGYLCTMCRCWLLNCADLQTVEGIRTQLFNTIKNNEQAVFEKFKIDQLSRILTFDTQALPNVATWSKWVRYLLQIFGSLVGLFILNASLTICVLGVILVISLTSIFFGYHINKLQNNPKDVEDNGQNALITLEHDMKHVRKTETRLLILGVVTEGVVGWLLTAATVIVLYYGGTLLNKHANDPEKGISAGELTACVLFLVQMGLACGYTLWSDSEPKQKIKEAKKRVTELQKFLENGRPD